LGGAAAQICLSLNLSKRSLHSSTGMGRVDGKELRFAGGVRSCCGSIRFAEALFYEEMGIVIA